MRGVAVVVATAISVAAGGAVLAWAGDGPTTGSGAAPELGCPDNPLRLGSDAPAPATIAALAEAPGLYGPKHDNPVADGADRARVAGVRGVQVRRTCGRRVFRRTVVVSLRFPELRKSASLSSGVVFVSRLSDGYHVWEIAH